MRRTGRTADEVAEVPPAACSNGHPYRPGGVLVGYLPCICGPGRGHRTYRCRTCDVVDHYPPHDPRLTATQGTVGEAGGGRLAGG
jgi:hypothetical protein